MLLVGALLCTVLQISAQKVTLNHQNVQLGKIFSDITRQTGYPVNYSRPTVDPEQTASIHVADTELRTALEQLFAGTNITSEIRGGKVYLSEKLSNTNNAMRSVSGTVSDAAGAMVGVAVVVKGSSRGVATGIDGRYTLNVAPGEILQFSLIGYQTVEIAYAGQTSLNVTMQEESQTVQTVVVTALGIKRDEKALSYNVQQIKAEELTTVKDANFVNSLVGKVAGIQINSSSAGVGGAARVVIRGEKSITGNNNALYVIDGIPMFNTSFGGSDGFLEGRSGSEGIADINPEDIESVNMLSGPSAAALYGNIASNGVILVNTKRGDKDKTVVTIGNSTQFSSAYIMPQMQSKYGNIPGEFGSWGAVNVGGGNYDPQQFYNTGTNIINSASVSTGNAKNQTYLSLSSTNAAGILPNNEYDRYNFTGRNTTSFAKDKLTLDMGASFIIQHDRNMTAQGQYFNPIPALYLFPRGENFNDVRMYERYNEARSINLQYWPYGDQGLSLQNPYWISNRMNRTTDKKRYMLNASLKWEIADWIDASGRIKIDNSHYILKDQRYASTLTTFAGENGFYSEINRRDRNTYADVLVNIHKTWNDFSINANIGASIRDQLYDLAGNEGNLDKKANFFTIRNIDYTNNYKPKQMTEHTQSQGVYGSVEVGWKSMLYLTVTGRNDWESQLAFSDQSSFFYPSVGLSAIISQMVNLPQWFSYLKVRGSWAKTGNSFAAYLSNPGYTYNEQSHEWATSTTFPALHLRPEDTKTYELGLNAKFWNKLNFDISFYRSNTYNQTFNIALSSSSGYNSTIIQTGNIQNQGIELSLGYNNKWGDWRLNSSVTYTLNQSEVKELIGHATNPVTGEPIIKDQLEVATLGYNGYGPRIILRKGGSMSDLYVDKHLAYDGNGDIMVDSQTGGLKTEEYATPRKIGQMAARYRMGWSNTLAWKGIELGTVFSARVGGLCVSNTQGVLDYFGVSKSSADARDAGGVYINTGYVNAQKYYQTVGGATGGLGEHYIYSATNVRLQELSVNYTLPKRWFRNKANLTIGFVGKNLWMIYNKAPFDPELSPSTTSTFYQGVDYFMQPSLRNYGFNIKLQF